MRLENKRLCYVGLLACVVGAGCVAEPASEGQAQRAITNGTADTGDLGVVAVYPQGFFSECTGSLVSPRVVLIAAHCLIGNPTFVVFFGASLSVPSQGQVLQTVQSVGHPLFDPQTYLHDLALVALATPAPANATPWPLSRTAFDDTFVNRPIRLVGYGLTARNAPPVGAKNQGNTNLASFTEHTFMFMPTPSQTCIGDSGGPAFMTINGTEYQIGVTSKGDDQCQMWGRDTRVDPYVGPFIQPYMKAFAGGLNVGDRCFLDENCTSGMCLPSLDTPTLRFCAAECQTDSNCPAPLMCATVGTSKHCAYAIPSPGVLGSACTDQIGCASGLCATPASGTAAVCSRGCAMGEGTCPAGFDCLADSANHPYCFKHVVPSDQGCAVAVQTAAPASGLLVGFLLLVFLGGRRRR
jgi:MYXO-CTERM domain-containing protein